MAQQLPRGRRRQGYAVSAIDGTPLYYTLTEPAMAPEASDAVPTVILSDGIGCDGYVWKYLEPALLDRYRVIHWHYRGHGRTPTPRDRERLAIADLADDLAAVLDDAEVERAIACGHSMGVQVSLETYRRHPHRVEALVLLCGAPENPLRTFKGSDRLETVLPTARRLVGRAPGLIFGLARRILPTRLSLELAKRLEINAELLEDADFMPYLEGIARIDPQLFLAMLAEAGRHTTIDLLPRVEVPTLVIAGQRDGFTPPQLSEAMAAAIPRAELVMVEDGSHTAPIERPNYVNGVILRFLERARR